MASEGTEATDAGEPEQQRWPAPVTSPSGECAGSSPAGEQLGVEGGESPSDSPVRAERSGGESLIGEIPRLVAEALLDADAHASPLDNAAQAPGEDARDKQPSQRRRAGEQHVGRTAGRDSGMARQGGHGQNGSHLQAAKDYKNLDRRPSSGACERMRGIPECCPHSPARTVVWIRETDAYAQMCRLEYPRLLPGDDADGAVEKIQTGAPLEVV